MKLKHSDLIKKLTLKEKAALLSGHGEWDTWEIKRLNIPSMIMSDGPNGVRRQAGAGDHLGLNESLPATCFPTAATLASSWDIKLAEEIGTALGEEAMAMDVNVLLGPGLNIKRSPLCGRNFEYFSEDPYLAGKLAAGYIRGVNDTGVYGTLKHFAVNSQEERRMAMNAEVDERALREIYLTGFEIGVKEGGAKAIMSSYNEVNGTYTNESKHLLTEILRDEWGFDGYVVTDWGGSNDHVEGVKAGSNLEMPNPGLASARELIAAVKEGRLSEDVIDERVDELLDIVLTVTKNAEGHGTKYNEQFDKEGHHALAGKAAGESAILLKNEDDILPLKKGVKVAVIGDFAYNPRYQGAGSSMVNSTKVDNVRQVIQRKKNLDICGFARGYNRDGMRNDKLMREALKLAKKADVVLYFFGLNEISESEGLDRRHMMIPSNQIELLQSLSTVNKNIVGVISAGSPIEMPWDNYCKGLLHSYLMGQAGAGAVVDILTGKINPSGKLAETYPCNYIDTPAYNYYPAKEHNSDYRESVFVGYRYYDTVNKKVKYPFGFGLSYTTFEYSDLTVTKKGAKFTLKNTGEKDGAEVAQLYVSMKDSDIFRPEKELKGFEKVYLKAGESKQIEIPFDEYTFRYWNVKDNKWSVEDGTYIIKVGGSSDNLPQSANLKVQGESAKGIYDREKLPSYFCGNISEVSDEEFSNVLGRKVSDGRWGDEMEANSAICQMKNARLPIARLIVRFLENKEEKAERKGKIDLNSLFVMNMPFRAVAKMTAGMVDMNMVSGIVDSVNGHVFKGIFRIITGYFKNKKENKKYSDYLKG